MPRRGVRSIACGIVAIALLGSTASAQEQPGDAATRSQLLFEQGIARADRGDWSGAAARFRASLAIEPTDRTAFNLARALTALGEVDEAASLLRRIVEDPGSDLLIRDAAQMLLDEISPRLASGTSPVPSPREAARSSMESATASDGGASIRRETAESVPITERWWFWTGAGALAVTAVVVGVLVATGGPEPAQGDVGPVYVGGGS